MSDVCSTCDGKGLVPDGSAYPNPEPCPDCGPDDQRNPTEGVLATYIPVDGDPEKCQWVPWPFVPAISMNEHKRRKDELLIRAEKAEQERDQFRSQAALFQSGVVEAEQERDALRDQLNEAKLQNVLHLDRIDALLAGYPTSSDGDRRSPHHNSAGELLSARDPWKGAP